MTYKWLTSCTLSVSSAYLEPRVRLLEKQMVQVNKRVADLQAVAIELCWKLEGRESQMAKQSKFLDGSPKSNWEGSDPLLTKPKARKTNAPLQPGSRGLGRHKPRVMKGARRGK